MGLRYFIGIFIVLCLTWSCQKQDGDIAISDEPILVIPQGFPTPSFPEDNEFTDERWELGKKLFYDPIMSRSGTVRCASCHLAAFAFSDTVSFSDGVDGAPGVRNAPTLANVAYHPYYTREGGVPTLEMQVLVPIQEHNEFDFNILEISGLLKNDADYREMSEIAYGREPDHFVITRALATFERSLISGNSRYDQYVYQGNRKAMTKEELQGMELFFGKKANCAACHGDFNFTDYSFQNNGLYTSYADEGRLRLTGLEKDRALFKVPSLRNIELTAPYMHDGSINSLEEVVAHYNSGGKEHPNKSEYIKPLNLSAEEKASLLAFLKTLTDSEFVSNQKFKQ